MSAHNSPLSTWKDTFVISLLNSFSRRSPSTYIPYVRLSTSTLNPTIDEESVMTMILDLGPQRGQRSGCYANIMIRQKRKKILKKEKSWDPHWWIWKHDFPVQVLSMRLLTDIIFFVYAVYGGKFWWSSSDSNSGGSASRACPQRWHKKKGTAAAVTQGAASRPLTPTT